MRFCFFTTLFLWLLGILAAPALAEDALLVPRADGVVLDGKPDEDAWKDAAVLITAPTPPLGTEPAKGKPALPPMELKLLVSDGRLCVALRMHEDPGTAMGLHWKLASVDAKSAADALSIDFRPVELRAPRFAVRGPRGVGRSIYRVDGGADWKASKGGWSLEVGLPLVDVIGDEPKAPLRLAWALYTRTPNVLRTFPAEAAWKNPTHWLEIKPGKGGWSTDVTVDEERLRKEEASDRKRQDAWMDFLRGSSVPVNARAQRASIEEALKVNLFDPLEAVLGHRPDLSVPVLCLRGDIHLRLGQREPALKDFHAAAQEAPAWREAWYGFFVKLARSTLDGGIPKGLSDYERAFEDLFPSATPMGSSTMDRFFADGVALQGAILEYKHGDFQKAIKTLDQLAQRYPTDEFIGTHAGFARTALKRRNEELKRRKQDEGKPLPRAVLETTAGEIVIELFPDDAPNTVNNFIYLARKGFYDGLSFHRVVPFFLVQSGDPATRSEDPAILERVGLGTPGYAIRTEKSERAMLRGAVAMASAGPDSEGSQFYILTGTAIHLQGEQAVFGRVVEGQAVAEALAKGARIQRVVLRGLDPESAYHPATVSGRRAPEPK